MKYIENDSRIIESVLGITGGIISLIACSFVLFFGSLGFDALLSLGMLGIIGSLMGIYAGVYVRSDNLIAGLFFITAGVLVIIGATFFGIPGMLLLFAAGFLALFRN